MKLDKQVPGSNRQRALCLVSSYPASSAGSILSSSDVLKTDVRAVITTGIYLRDEQLSSGCETLPLHLAQFGKKHLHETPGSIALKVT